MRERYHGGNLSSMARTARKTRFMKPSVNRLQADASDAPSRNARHLASSTRRPLRLPPRMLFGARITRPLSGLIWPKSVNRLPRLPTPRFRMRHCIHTTNSYFFVSVLIGFENWPPRTRLDADAGTRQPRPPDHRRVARTRIRTSTLSGHSTNVWRRIASSVSGETSRSTICVGFS